MFLKKLSETNGLPLNKHSNVSTWVKETIPYLDRAPPGSITQVASVLFENRHLEKLFANIQTRFAVASLGKRFEKGVLKGVVDPDENMTAICIAGADVISEAGLTVVRETRALVAVSDKEHLNGEMDALVNHGRLGLGVLEIKLTSHAEEAIPLGWVVQLMLYGEAVARASGSKVLPPLWLLRVRAGCNQAIIFRVNPCKVFVPHPEFFPVSRKQKPQCTIMVIESNETEFMTVIKSEYTVELTASMTTPPLLQFEPLFNTLADYSNPAPEFVDISLGVCKIRRSPSTLLQLRETMSGKIVYEQLFVASKFTMQLVDEDESEPAKSVAPAPAPVEIPILPDIPEHRFWYKTYGELLRVYNEYKKYGKLTVNGIDEEQTIKMMEALEKAPAKFTADWVLENLSFLGKQKLFTIHANPKLVFVV